MDGKILDSEGQYVADIRANQIYDLSGKKLYDPSYLGSWRQTVR